MARIKDSGSRRAFSTGSHRDAETGKGRFDLSPYRALAALAKHMEAGCAKYDDRNWEKGQPLHVYLDCAERHLAKAAVGIEDEPHFAAALWNLACLIDTQQRIREGLLPATLDDLPKLTPEQQARCLETNWPEAIGGAPVATN